MTTTTRPPSTMIEQFVWPDRSDVAYVYRGEGRDRPRYMRHGKLGWERPGVTTILRPWDKEGLVKWASDTEREACLIAAAAAFADGAESVPEFVAAVEAKLGHARAAQRQKEKGADIGTAAHKLIEWRIRQMLGLSVGPEPKVPDESLLAVMSWEDHWKEAGITPLRVEQPVWSDKYGYAGTVDLIGLRDGKLGIPDIKTSKGIYGSHHQQLAAYAHAIEEMTGLRVEWAEIWRVPKTLEGDLHLEVVPLGQLKKWNGARFVPDVQSRDEILAAFLGVLDAWRVMCRTP